MIIRAMDVEDLEGAARVHQQAFSRQRLSLEWLDCNLKAFPRILCYMAELEKEVAGYITWVQKSGFRPEAIMELEQLAVGPDLQGQGIGKTLISKSLELVREQLTNQQATLKHVIVTTRADNHAQAIYKTVLGAEIEATITNLYSADEVFMVARNL